MAFINKCSICTNKGLLLKIKNGLCPECLNELKTVESEYTSLLQLISINPTEKKQYYDKLNTLLPSIQKFINSSYIFNINTISQLISSLNEQNTYDKNFQNINFPINLENNSITSSTSSTEHLIDTPNIRATNSPVITTELTNSYGILENTENKNEDIPIDITAIDEEIATIENKQLPLLNHSDKVLLDNLYTNTSAILELLNDPSISLNALGENYFKLKNSYYPLLKEYNIQDVNNINIYSFLNILEKKLYSLTNTNSETLYSFFNYVTLAIQTSGINAKSNFILEICAQKVNFGKITDKFYTLINPLSSITSLITNKTGITSDMISSAPTIDIALNNFRDFIEDYTLVIYNSLHVWDFINFYHNNLFGYNLKNNTVCCSRLYRSRYKKYHGVPTKEYDLCTICQDLLPNDDVTFIQSLSSISESSTFAIYKVYEILKLKYK